MKSVKSFQENLDKYGVSYTIGTQEEVENTIENLDKLMDEIFFKNNLELNKETAIPVCTKTKIEE